MQFKDVYDFFVSCKVFRINCKCKHEHFSQKIDNQLIAYDHETRSRVNNNLVIPRN